VVPPDPVWVAPPEPVPVWPPELVPLVPPDPVWPVLPPVPLAVPPPLEPHPTPTQPSASDNIPKTIRRFMKIRLSVRDPKILGTRADRGGTTPRGHAAYPI